MVKERAHIPASEDVELVTYPPRRTLLEVLSQQMGGRSSTGVWGLLATRRPPVPSLATSLQMFRRGEPLALMPLALVR